MSVIVQSLTICDRCGASMIADAAQDKPLNDSAAAQFFIKMGNMSAEYTDLCAACVKTLERLTEQACPTVRSKLISEKIKKNLPLSVSVGKQKTASKKGKKKE